MPNVFDQYDTQPNIFDQYDTPQQTPPGVIPAHPGILNTWPVRVAKGIYHGLENAATLPHDVYTGQVDPESPEGIARVADMAAVVSPMNPAMRAGDFILPGLARRTPAGANVGPAEAAVSIGEGKGLPIGISSPNPIVRATTQGMRHLPFVGPYISEGVQRVIEKAGERVGGMGEGMRQGAAGRQATGAALRPEIENIIKSNNDAMSAEYNGVRNMIDTGKTFELPETEAAFNNVLKARGKKANPMEGLGDVAALIKRPASPDIGPTVLRGTEALGDKIEQPWGANFEELHRVRSDFGNKTKFGEPNPGYSEGERKYLYGAMTRDLENNLRSQAGEEAVSAHRVARANAQEYIENNRALSRLTNLSDEKLAGTLIGAAGEKTGNLELLTQLRGPKGLPPEDFQRIGGAVLGEIGKSKATGEFSLNHFTTNWNAMSDGAKNVLFEPAHKKALDEIASVGTWLKNSDQYVNKSSTGHTLGLVALMERAGEWIAHAAAGNYKQPLMEAGGIGSGYLMGRILGRPASASSVASWARAAQRYGARPSIPNQVGLRLATTNLLHNVGDVSGMLRDAASRSVGLPGPQAAETNGANPPH